MQITRIPVLEDNYIFVLSNDRGEAAVLDPAEAPAVESFLRENGLTLTAILNTHHHGDHVGGNRALLRLNPGAAVYGGEVDRGRIPGQSHFLKEGDTVEVLGVRAKVLFVPGHTRGHVAYFFERPSCELFIGDTLFGGGCGKLFEGTFEQMLSSLKKVRALPSETRVWCAHEYTQKNLEIAALIEPKNKELANRLAQVRELRRQNEPTVPLSLALEAAVNPFLRWDDPSLRQATHTSTELETFTYVREFRDRY